MIKTKKYKHIDFKPPKSVAKEAEKGLKYRRMAGGKGGLSVEQAKAEGVGSGVQRAVNLKNRDTLSPETIKRMKAFFDRHQKNKAINPKYKDEPWKDKGYVAWLIWGGDSGYVWAKKVISQMEEADKKDKSVMAHKIASNIIQYEASITPDTMFNRTDVSTAAKAAEKILKGAVKRYNVKYEEILKTLFDKPKKTETKAIDKILQSVARRFKVDYETLVKNLIERSKKYE